MLICKQISKNPHICLKGFVEKSFGFNLVPKLAMRMNAERSTTDLEHLKKIKIFKNLIKLLISICFNFIEYITNI